MKLADHQIVHHDLYREGRRKIDVHRGVREEWLKLLFSPAAIDNWAQTTPMPVRFVRGRSPTVGFRSEEFQERVENSISFLNYARHQEQLFTSAFSDDDLRGFRTVVPSLSDHLRASYVKRLRDFRRVGQPRGHFPTYRWWDEKIQQIAGSK